MKVLDSNTSDTKNTSSKQNSKRLELINDAKGMDIKIYNDSGKCHYDCFSSKGRVADFIHDRETLVTYAWYDNGRIDLISGRDFDILSDTKAKY